MRALQGTSRSRGDARRAIPLCFWVLLGLLAGATTLPGAQAPQQETTSRRDDQPLRPGFVETVEVNLVSIDVWVTDDRGAPVPGLRREDFEMLVGGKPVPITHFSAAPDVSDITTVASAAEGGTESAVGPPPVTPLNIAVVMDLDTSRPGTRRTLLKEIAGLLAKPFRAAPRVMVASFEREVVVQQPFTTDPAVVNSVLDRLAAAASSMSGIDTDARFLMTTMQRARPIPDLGTSQPAARGASRDLEFRREDALALLEQIRRLGEREREWSVIRIRALGRFVDALAGVPGHKVLLLAGGGLGGHRAEGMLQTWIDRFPGLAREQNVVPATEEAERSLDPELGVLVERANASFVSLYTVDLSDPHGFKQLNAENIGTAGGQPAGLFDPLDAQAAYLRLAHDTGGLPLATTAEGLGTMVRDHGSAYSLGFEPPSLEPDRQEKIVVRVKREGLHVRHRSAIMKRSPVEELTSLTLASLFFDAGTNPLGVTIDEEGQPHSAGNHWDVTAVVHVPLAKIALLPEGEAHQGRLTIYIAVKDETGRVSPVSSRLFPLRVANESLSTALGQYASFAFNLELRPGPHRLAVTVNDELGAVASTTSMPIVLPDGR
jgi:VWFA-related protein